MRLLRGVPRRLRATCEGDEGNAVVEFLGVTLILLVPTVYLVLTLGRIQAGTFAAESAAAQAGRAVVVAGDYESGVAAALDAVELALADQGFRRVDPAKALTIACSSSPCRAPGSTVATTVRVRVPLPFVPDVVRSAVPLYVTVEASHLAAVDMYGGAG